MERTSEALREARGAGIPEQWGVEWGRGAGEARGPDGAGPCRSNRDVISCYTENRLEGGALQLSGRRCGTL